VVLAVRDIEKGKRAAARIAGTAPGTNVMVQHLDLASLDSVRAAQRTAAPLDRGGDGMTTEPRFDASAEVPRPERRTRRRAPSGAQIAGARR